MSKVLQTLKIVLATARKKRKNKVNGALDEGGNSERIATKRFARKSLLEDPIFMPERGEKIFRF